MHNPDTGGWGRLAAAAAGVAGRLEQLQTVRVVFAESCTAGMVSAALGGIPGISRFLCGSLVTYRGASKSGWLGIPQSLLLRYSAESPEVSEALAVAALRLTPEADLAVAVTGHLGPLAPEEVDGRIHAAVAGRSGDGAAIPLQGRSFQLTSLSRADRQIESAGRVLECLLAELNLRS